MHTEWNLEHLHKLIARYLKDECSAEEKREVEAWYESLGQEIETYSTDPETEKLRAEVFQAVIREREPFSETGSVISMPSSWRRRISVAAICILLAGFGSMLYWLAFYQPRSSFATSYGKIDTLILPDRSTVVLNANSKLKYSPDWSKDQPREVWLDGEALFSVVHRKTANPDQPYGKFIVHAKQVDIEVLGTVFNVRQRRGRTSVVLQAGRIQLKFKESRQAVIVMHPGQIVTLDEEKITRGSTKPEDYMAWTEKKLIMADPSLADFAEYLEDNYGKKIAFADTSLAGIRIGGTLMIDNLDDALLILSKALNLEVVEKNNTLFISPK